jgi:hypothetical protein
MKTLGELLTAIDDANPTKVRECLKLIATAWLTNPKEDVSNGTLLDPDTPVDSESLAEVTTALSRFGFWPEV